MTVILALLAVVVVALCCIVVIAFFDTHRQRQLREAFSASVAARSADVDRYRDATSVMNAAYANSAIALSSRPTDELRLVLDAVIADRDRLLTALLARQDPNAARIVGLVDKSNADGVREMNRRDFLEEQILGRRLQPDTEFATSDGDVIVPVGMTGS